MCIRDRRQARQLDPDWPQPVSYTHLDVYKRQVLGHPAAETVASQAGLKGGERVLRVGLDDGTLAEVASFEDVRWALTRGALEGLDVRLVVAAAHEAEREVVLKVSDLAAAQVDAQLLAKIGIVGPFSRPVIGEVMACLLYTSRCV